MEVDFGDVALNELGAEALGLLTHLFHQLRAFYPFREAGKIVDGCGRCQLPSGLDTVDQERAAAAAARIDCGRQSGGS